jgi:uncharacterized membrane protein
MDELQEMREQLAALKEKLNKQEVVNDRLIRDVLSQKMKVINKNGWISGICGLFVITFGNYLFYQMGLSTWFLLGTTVMMIFCAAVTWISHSWVNSNEIAHGDLLRVVKQAQRLQRVYKNWKYIALPMVLVWATWLGLEYAAEVKDTAMVISMMSGGIIGGLVGGIIGFKQNKKVTNELDEMIRHIEEMSALDEKKEELKNED